MDWSKTQPLPFLVSNEIYLMGKITNLLGNLCRLMIPWRCVPLCTVPVLFFRERTSVQSVPFTLWTKKSLCQTSGWSQIPPPRISSKFHPLRNEEGRKKQDVFCTCMAAAIWLVEIRTNGKRVAILVEHIEVHAGRLQQGRQAGVLARLWTEPTHYSILKIF